MPPQKTHESPELLKVCFKLVLKTYLKLLQLSVRAEDCSMLPVQRKRRIVRRTLWVSAAWHSLWCWLTYQTHFCICVVLVCSVCILGLLFFPIVKMDSDTSNHWKRGYQLNIHPASVAFLANLKYLCILVALICIVSTLVATILVTLILHRY